MWLENNAAVSVTVPADNSSLLFLVSREFVISSFLLERESESLSQSEN